MAIPKTDKSTQGKISPPPIREDIISNNKATQALVRFLLDLRKSGFNGYSEIDRVIEFANNIQEGAGLNDDGTYSPDILANYIKEATTLKEADSLLDTIAWSLKDGAGLNDDGTYSPSSLTQYIKAANSLYNADVLLDAAIWKYTREAISSVSGNSSLIAQAQTVLCDATSGAISITLPKPSDCFQNNRSLRFAIHKIDSSSNVVNIIPNGLELIIGEASQYIDLEGEILNLITDGTNWYLGA